jgi:hypothetical protein
MWRTAVDLENIDSTAGVVGIPLVAGQSFEWWLAGDLLPFAA